jgi:hypothetical protein
MLRKEYYVLHRSAITQNSVMLEVITVVEIFVVIC